MPLLNVRVKKAQFVCEDADQFNSYVTLKLQNVKSTTVTVKGANPCWEQDFLFETNDMNTDLLVEVWCKGFLWDRFLGYYYLPLSDVSYMNEEGSGQWVSLDSELEMRGAEIIGTKKPTGHSLLIDCRLERPFDPENTEADLPRKLEMLNNMMDQEARAEQARRQILYNIGHFVRASEFPVEGEGPPETRQGNVAKSRYAGYSEDSDYTSDLNYPVGGQGANSSASQFRTAANQLATPQRSLETSRENSCERDDHQIPAPVGSRLLACGGKYDGYGGSGHSPRYDEPYPEEGPAQRYSQSQHASESSEPLFYNSRPRHYKEYRRRKHTWDYEDSQDGWYSEGYDTYHTSSRAEDTWVYSDTEYYPGTTSSSRRRGPHRRPSLERQMTLYDDHPYYTDGYSSDGRIGKMSATYPECQTDIRYNEYYDTITGYAYQDERYGQDDEDRQWDSGGKWQSGTSTYYENKRNRKMLPQRPASSIGIHRPDYRPAVTRQRSYDSEEFDYSGHSRRRKPLQPQRSTSRLEGTGKKLPPTPTKPSSVAVSRKLTSLPATPNRQLPKIRTPSEESYYKSDYNEDYNYAYRSQDNLPQDAYTDNTYAGKAGYDQVPVPDKTLYPEVSQENQYGSTYVSEVDGQYPHTYPQPQPQTQPPDTTFDQSYLQNSYKDKYYQPYAQENTQVYQDTYHDATYPIASQANDQYTSQANDQFGKTGSGMIIEDNYPVSTYEQNNVQYQDTYKSDTYTQDTYKQDTYKQDTYKQDTYKQDTYKPDTYKQDTYKQETYPEQYDEYGVAVPSSVYDQNNVTNTYNQYQQEQYDGQYNINTSTGYQKGYQDSRITRSSRTYSQEAYNQETYNQDVYNQDAYKQDAYNEDAYNQDPYKLDAYKQDAYKQDAYEQDTRIKSRQASYEQDVYGTEAYKQDTYKQDTYSQDGYKQETYSQDGYKQETYSQDGYKQDIYSQEGYKQDTYTQDGYKQDAYAQDTYKQDMYDQDRYKQDAYGQDTYKQDTYGETAYGEDAYKQDTYKQDTYKQDGYEQDTYKQDTYKQDTYKQDGYEQDTYKQDTYDQDTYQQDTYKQDPYQQDTYKQDAYKQDAYQKDTYKQDTYSQDAYKQDTYNQEAYKPEIYTEEAYNQDTYNRDAYNQETYDQSTYGEDGYPRGDNYNQEPYEQVPVTSAPDSYQETYPKQQKEYDEYQTPYSQAEPVTSTYQNEYKDQYQDQYQDYQDQYEDAYQDSYQEPYEDSYKESQQPVSTERRQSEVPELSVTTPRGQTRTNGYQSGEEYYYPAEDKQEISATGLTRRKKLMKRDTSSLVQQNTDSLESRDDELKESFETAVSSLSSGQQKKGYDYPGDDSSSIAATSVDLSQTTPQPATTMMNHVTANHTSTMKVTAMVHTGTAVNGKRLTRTESYHEQEEDEYPPEIIPKEPQRKDSQLSHHSQLSQHSLHSQHSQISQHSQKSKLTRGESYASDHFPEESFSRRGSYAQSTRKDSLASVIQDGFKPPLTRTDSYQKRGSYSQNLPDHDIYERDYYKEEEEPPEEPEMVNGDYKISDEALERYERGEDAMIRASREDSLVDTYKETPPMSQDSPRGSITKQASLEESIQMDTPPRSIPEPPAEEDLLEMVGAAPVPTQLKERPEMNARQRWHWAYNQIIMQLNVSINTESSFTSCKAN